MKRNAISKKDRFEIFKRDSFRCVYCGKQPPETTLVLEHIIPVAKGGLNQFDNYCTSCIVCNQGKGARLLTSVHPSVMERLAFLQEKLEEIAALRDQSLAAKKIKEDADEIKQDIVDHWCEVFQDQTMPKSVLSMIYNRLEWIDIPTMYELIDSCAAHTISRGESTKARYMGGILRNHLAKIGIDYKKEIGAE